MRSHESYFRLNEYPKSMALSRSRLTLDFGPRTLDLRRGDISSDRLWPQHGFYDPPNAVLVRKPMWQRQINALLVHEPQLALLLPNKLLDSLPIVISEDDKLPFH